MIEPRHLEYWRQRQHTEQQRNQRLAQQAWQNAHAIADCLRRDFQASQIVVFGSLTKAQFTPTSDIDIAAAGIPKTQYFAALAAANRLSAWWVDLKPWEDLEPHFQKRILQTGKILHAPTDRQ